MLKNGVIVVKIMKKANTKTPSIRRIQTPEEENTDGCETNESAE